MFFYKSLLDKSQSFIETVIVNFGYWYENILHSYHFLVHCTLASICTAILAALAATAESGLGRES